MNATQSGLVGLDFRSLTSRLTTLCLFSVLIVGCLDFFLYYLEWLPSEIVSRSFDVGREESLGTWVSANLALLAGTIAGLVAAAIYRAGNRGSCLGWILVALFFVYISFDDAAKFHERMGTALRLKMESISGAELVQWFPSWGWQIYVAPVFAASGLVLCWFFWRALSIHLFAITLLGFALLGAAVGIDFMEGVMDRGQQDIVHLMLLCEEMLEMFGITAFIYVFGSVLGEHVSVFVAVRARSTTQ